MCDMTPPYVWHDPSICLTWLLHLCDATVPYVWRDSTTCVTWHNHDSTTCATWTLHMCDSTPSHVWQNSSMYVTWLSPTQVLFMCVLCVCAAARRLPMQKRSLSQYHVSFARETHDSVTFCRQYSAPCKLSAQDRPQKKLECTYAVANYDTGSKV